MYKAHDICIGCCYINQFTLTLQHFFYRFLWRQNATFAISRHYTRFDVFEEAEANKAGGKYDNSSIDYQIEFYKKEGLTHYTAKKLPITSGKSIIGLYLILFAYFRSQN